MKKSTRIKVAVLGLLLMLPLAATTLMSPVREQQMNWPDLAKNTAEEISLTQAWSLLNNPVPGRRAGVMGDSIYIETPSTPDQDVTPEVGQDPSNPAAGFLPTLPGQSADGKYIHHVAQLPYPSSEFINTAAKQSGVDVRIYEAMKFEASLTDRIISLAPLVFFGGLIIFMLSRGATKSLGLSSAFKVIKTEDIKETFDDVAGMDSARAEIEEIVNFLKNPKEACRLGGRLPKGALFDGPPGAGKTLLARAMAKEAGVPFLTIEASSVNQLFVGAGTMKIRKAFAEARKIAPCIVFIDEIDAMGKARGTTGGGGGGDEKETTLNALLVELDGFDTRDGVFLVAATNRPEVLDPALTRRGRIDRKISVDLPDIEARKSIIEVHCRKIKAVTGLDVDSIARTTFGFSGADLAALTNEAALVATRCKRDYVELQDFQTARDRLIVGLSGQQRKMNDADRRLTAIHEAGHALIAATNPNADPVEKATIMPQGRAAGYVMQSPDADRTFETYDRLMARIQVAIAGREAEALIFGPGAITSGASSDIEQATRVARAMVTRFGMSSQGFIAIDPNDPMLYDQHNPPVREINRIIEDCRSVVAINLQENRAKLEAIADALMASETIDGAEVRRLAAP